MGWSILIYTYVIAGFDLHFNSLFLVYVALLGCSVYALVGGLVTADLAGIKARFSEQMPIRAAGIDLAVLSVLFYFVWLSEVVPALIARKTPQSVVDRATPTNPVHVLDMAWILPALGITAVSLWRKQPLGYALAGALLTYAVLLGLAILSMAVYMIRGGQPIVVPLVSLFGFLLAVSFGMLIWYLKGLKSLPDLT